MDSERLQVMESGVNDFLHKPINTRELFDKLKKHLQLEWAYSEAAAAEPRPEDRASASILFPDTATLTDLGDLAVKGNIKGILRYIDQLVEGDPDLAPFTEQIRQYAQAFDDEAILTYLNNP